MTESRVARWKIILSSMVLSSMLKRVYSRLRWPLLLIGKNSVSPCTIAKISSVISGTSRHSFIYFFLVFVINML